MAKPGKKAQQIGGCAPREYNGPAMSNPYWQKMDFDKKNPEFRTSSDSGMDPLASIEIGSPQIASAEIAPTQINFAETAESVANDFFPTDAGLNQPIPVPLAGLTFPGPSSPEFEYLDFNVKRRRKRSQDIWTGQKKEERKNWTRPLSLSNNNKKRGRGGGVFLDMAGFSLKLVRRIL